MKIIFTFLLILIPSFTFSQTTSSKLKSLIPKNWEVLTYAEGSLSADNLDDLAIIIQPKNTNIKNRKLLIFFKQNQSYQKILSKEIPEWTYRDQEACMSDAIDEDSLTIKNKILDISFNDLNTCSNWYGLEWKYRFKYIQSQFTLTGFDYWLLYKTDGTLKQYSGNFLTKKLKITLSNAFDENIQPKITWSSLKPIIPNTLQQIQFQHNQSALDQMTSNELKE
ncbi:hypothetical protein [Acinetobacter equi]|uniref:Uncharacterized protein n=1 Tax=Acinetobacter equi TaxID=1324350 RepID=A0A0N9VY78_9GAMM|nr:hypothetical protein [Acinetobacter equi]ALH96383.1 hypothetical protein AOY20_13015 [Acinetobacter equi]